MNAREWKLKERVFRAVDALVDTGALVMDPGNAHGQKFRLNPTAPKFESYLFTNDACGIREPGRNCHLFKDVLFDRLGVVPTYCMKRCFKIVIRVRSVAETFALFDVMKENAWPGKCGYDGRPYTFGTWVGFCYFPGRAEAEAAFDSRVAAVKARIPGAHLHLKRSCTEFELRSPSNTWDEEDPLADALAEYLSMWVEWDVTMHNQTAYAEERVKNYWIEQAYAMGDATLAEVVPDFRKMYPQTVKYREST